VIGQKGAVVWLKTPSRAGSLPYSISGARRICDHWRPDVGSKPARECSL